MTPTTSLTQSLDAPASGPAHQALPAQPDMPDAEQLLPAGRMIFSVRGMFCASCAMAVQRVIEKVPGVLSSHVNFTSGAALVHWDPAEFDFQRLFDCVDALGYELSPLLDNNELNQSLMAQASRIRLQLIIATFFGMWSMLGSWMLYLGVDAVAGIEPRLIGWAATLFSLPVVLYSGADFYRAAWKTLRAKVPGMDFLVSLGVWGSLALSLLNLFHGTAAVYVDAATMLITFLLLGRLIEIRARTHNLVAIDAMRQLLPETAHIMEPDGAKRLARLDAVCAGERVYILAGERIPVDGVIEDGASQLDASLLTGESLPVARQIGDQVHAGMVNLQAPLLLRVEQSLGNRRVDKLGLRMLELFGAKSSMSRTAERFVRLLLPFAMTVALLALIRHLWLGMALDGALLASLSVLVAACPCAVGLALPLAFSAGGAHASRRGILFRDPASVEALASANLFAFDKTGTLTTGQLEVAEVTTVSLPEDELIRIAASAEQAVAHPVADAIVRHAQARGMGSQLQSGKVERHGAGVRYFAPDGAVWLLGAPRWLVQQGVSDMPSESGLDSMAHTPGALVHMACNGRWAGRLALQDHIRQNARQALDTLRRQGCETLLVTGDGMNAALRVGEALGFARQDIHAACDPEDKVTVLQQRGTTTAFVGDGVNDTLVLAAATCGVAIQGANAIAVTASGVVITRGGVDQVVLARHMARRMVRRIRQNLFFSVCYNLAVVGLFFHVGVTPGAAAAAMCLSSLTVVGNSMRPL